MPRVIKRNALVEKTLVHSSCGAEIGYFENEVQTGVSHDALGGPQDDVEYRYINCPICKFKIYLNKRGKESKD